MNLTIYDFSPADGVTPFKHAVLDNGTVLYPSLARCVNAPLGWRRLSREEFSRWQNGVAYRDPRIP